MKHLVFLFLGIMNFATAQTCLPNGIVLTRQSQVDSFSIRYPDCTEILGKLRIENSTIVDLSGLENITKVQRGLTIRRNNSLVSVEGLHNLEIIEEHSDISENPVLESLNGLRGLREVCNRDVSGPNDVCEFRIFDNIAMEHLGLSSLEIAGTLSLQGNTALRSFRGLENLEEVLRDLTLTTSSHITSMEGLEGLKTVKGHFTLKGIGGENDSLSGLTTFEGLKNLEEVGDLTLEGHRFIENLNGLESLRKVKVFTINSFHNLSSLAGLNALDSIQNLFIGRNPVLSDLSALPTAHIGGGVVPRVSIYQNEQLSTLQGLEALSLDDNTFVIISNNTILSSCAVHNICNHLLAGRNTHISNNMDGCNSKQEVQDLCVLSTSETKLDTDLVLSPNPTSGHVTLSGEGQSQIVNIFVYNQLGQLMKSTAASLQILDFNSTSAGLYYVTIYFQDGSSQSYKVVKR